MTSLNFLINLHPWIINSQSFSILNSYLLGVYLLSLINIVYYASVDWDEVKKGINRTFRWCLKFYVQFSVSGLSFYMFS